MKRDKLLARDEFDRFFGALQHFEVARGLILSNHHEKSRMAIILLHSLAEGLMYLEAIGEFEKDIYFSRVLVPKYTAQYRKKVLWSFEEKVDFCRDRAQMISETDATIFKILHFYRNAAYHRDSHNPYVISSIARISFHATLRLFERTAGSDGRVSMEGLSQEQLSVLNSFCHVEGFIDYKKAANEAAQKLAGQAPTRPSEVRSAFVSDVENRVKKLERMKTETLYCEVSSDFDDLLKKAEFELKGIEDSLSAELKQLNYRITGQAPGGVPNRDEYQSVEGRYSRKLKAAFDSFIPQINAATLELIIDKLRLIQDSATLDASLSHYLEADKLLVEIEVLASHAERRIGEASQLQSDLERGK